MLYHAGTLLLPNVYILSKTGVAVKPFGVRRFIAAFRRRVMRRVRPGGRTKSGDESPHSKSANRPPRPWPDKPPSAILIQMADKLPNQRHWLRVWAAGLAVLLLLALAVVWIVVRVVAESPELRAIRAAGAKVSYVDTDGSFFKIIRVDLPAETTDADLEQFVDYLRRLPQLRGLGLSGTKVTDAGLAHLTRLPQLRGLNLRDTNITDAGLERLKDLPNLVWLQVYGTRVTSDGRQDLEEALPNLHIGEMMPSSLAERNEAVKGFQKTEAVDAIERSHGWVMYDYMETEPILMPADPRVRKPPHPGVLGLDFQVVSVGVRTDESVRACKEFTKLRSISLSHNVTDRGLEYLKDVPPFRELTLDHPHITSAGLAHLSSLTHLNKISLWTMPLDDDSLAFLERLPQLTSLHITDCPVTDAAMAHLRSLTCLEFLSLERTLVTGRGFVNLKDMSQLSHLYLEGSPITDAGLEHLEKLPRLFYVSLNKSKVTNAGVDRLQKAFHGKLQIGWP
jgi:internalin A